MLENFELSLGLLFISFLFLLTGRNILYFLFALEIGLIAIGVNFVNGSILYENIEGQAIALILLSIAATETAIGLILTLNYYNLRTFSTRFYLKK